jgi:hypothetical protein
MSRKRAEINLIELEKLAAMQATDEEIAQWFGVSPKTVQRRKRSSAEFRKALESGRAKGRISLRRNLMELSKTNVVAAIFLAKNQLGYTNQSSPSSTCTDPCPADLAERLRQGRERVVQLRWKDDDP